MHKGIEMVDSKKILNTTILAGEVLLYNGAEIFRIQETMIRIARAYGASEFHVYTISNGIFASIQEGDKQYCTQVRHIPLSPVHLGRVAAVNHISREIELGKYTLDEAYEQLEKVKEIPYKSQGLQILASGVGSGCFCYLLGGNLYDSVTSFLLGIVVYVFLILSGRGKLSKMMTHILASGLITLCGLTLFEMGMGNHIDKMIIGSIIPLVPGVPLTNAIRDFFNSDYLSGTIRLIDALVVAFCIALGVGGMLKMWSLLMLGG